MYNHTVRRPALGWTPHCFSPAGRRFFPPRGSLRRRKTARAIGKREKNFLSEKPAFGRKTKKAEKKLKKGLIFCAI